VSNKPEIEARFATRCGDLRRIDDACLHQVGVFTSSDVVTFVALARLTS
jgi:hypothetical protein